MPLRVLGWGVPWEGLSQKLTAALTAVRALPSDCVVTFTDAYDVLYTEELAAVRRKFDALQARAPAPLVFSGECGCWPQVTRDKGVTCRDKYPASPTPYRYLNSGGWIGYAGAAAEFLQALVDAGGGAKGKAFHKLNDQELASDMYMTGAHDITLDHYNTIFQAMHAIHDSTAVPNCDPWPHMREEDGVWHNDETRSRPAIYHFNGGGKAHHLSMEARTWWKTKARRAPRRRTARSTRRFHDQCGRRTPRPFKGSGAESEFSARSAWHGGAGSLARPGPGRRTTLTLVLARSCLCVRRCATCGRLDRSWRRALAGH